MSTERWLRETRDMLLAEGLLEPVLTFRSKHIKVEGRTPDGRSVSAFIASTPSDWRAARNNRSRIRRMIREVAT